jgi:hypothetical protein
VSFHKQDFNTRFGTMGDTAEAVYEQWADGNDIRFDRYGFNRPRSNMFKWPSEIRYTPDYITHDRLIEVKGCGRDGLAKIKQENLDALSNWQKHLPVWLFIWNSALEEHAYFELSQRFYLWLPKNCSNGRFPDNNKVFWNIPFQACQEKVWDSWTRS